MGKDKNGDEPPIENGDAPPTESEGEKLRKGLVAKEALGKREKERRKKKQHQSLAKHRASVASWERRFDNWGRTVRNLNRLASGCALFLFLVLFIPLVPLYIFTGYYWLGGVIKRLLAIKDSTETLMEHFDSPFTAGLAAVVVVAITVFRIFKLRILKEKYWDPPGF